MLVETFTIKDNLIDELTREIESAQVDLEYSEEMEERAKGLLADEMPRMEEESVAFKELLAKFREEHFDEGEDQLRPIPSTYPTRDRTFYGYFNRVCADFEDFEHARDRVFYRMDQRIDQHQDEVERLRAKIAFLKLKRANHVPCDRTIELADLRRAVESEQVSNLYLATHDDGSFKFLRFNVDNVVATVHGLDRRDYIGDITIKIPPSYVYLLPDGFRVVPRGQGIDGYMDSSSHPHTLSDHLVCGGDFSGSYVEAMSEYDFVTAVSVVMLFLESVNANDAAGQSWRRWANKMETDPVDNWSRVFWTQHEDTLVPVHLTFGEGSVTRELYNRYTDWVLDTLPKHFSDLVDVLVPAYLWLELTVSHEDGIGERLSLKLFYRRRDDTEKQLASDFTACQEELA